MSSKGTIVICLDWKPLINGLAKDKKLLFYDLLMDYSGLDYNPLIEDEHLKSVFDYAMVWIKANDQKWLDTREKRSEAGKLGGRPRKDS